MQQPTKSLPDYSWCARLASPLMATLAPAMKLANHGPFNEVTLGPLLGQGSFGRVYRAIWQGIDVAVKVSYVETRSAPTRLGHSSPTSS